MAADSLIAASGNTQETVQNQVERGGETIEQDMVETTQPEATSYIGTSAKLWANRRNARKEMNKEVLAFCQDPKKKTVPEMRQWIPRMFIALYKPDWDVHKKYKDMWKREPDDWDSSIPFVDPNNKPNKFLPKPDKKVLGLIYNYLQRKVLQRYSSDHCNVQEEAGRWQHPSSEVHMADQDVLTAEETSPTQALQCDEQVQEEVTDPVNSLFQRIRKKRDQVLRDAIFPEEVSQILEEMFQKVQKLFKQSYNQILGGKCLDAGHILENLLDKIVLQVYNKDNMKSACLNTDRKIAAYVKCAEEHQNTRPPDPHQFQAKEPCLLNHSGHHNPCNNSNSRGGKPALKNVEKETRNPEDENDDDDGDDTASMQSVISGESHDNKADKKPLEGSTSKVPSQCEDTGSLPLQCQDSTVSIGVPSVPQAQPYDTPFSNSYDPLSHIHDTSLGISQANLGLPQRNYEIVKADANHDISMKDKENIDGQLNKLVSQCEEYSTPTDIYLHTDSNQRVQNKSANCTDKGPMWPTEAMDEETSGPAYCPPDLDLQELRDVNSPGLTCSPPDMDFQKLWDINKWEMDEYLTGSSAVGITPENDFTDSFSDCPVENLPVWNPYQPDLTMFYNQKDVASHQSQFDYRGASRKRKRDFDM